MISKQTIYIVSDDEKWNSSIQNYLNNSVYIHTISVNMYYLEASFRGIKDNDILLFHFITHGNVLEFNNIKDQLSTTNQIYIYSPDLMVGITNQSNIHLINGFKTNAELVKVVEEATCFYPNPTRLKFTYANYIDHTLKLIGIDECMVGHRYIGYMLNYALKHFQTSDNIYQHAFTACKNHYDISDEILEKALRDAINHGYEHLYSEMFFFIHRYDLLHHHPTNTRFIECAIDYAINHFDVCLKQTKRSDREFIL